MFLFSSRKLRWCAAAVAGALLMAAAYVIESKGRGPTFRTPAEVQDWALSHSNPERDAHFAWLQSHQMVVTGWFGTIKTLPAVAGMPRFQVRIRPDLHSVRGGVPFTQDCVVETYAFRRGSIHLIAVEDPPEGRSTFLVTD